MLEGRRGWILFMFFFMDMFKVLVLSRFLLLVSVLPSILSFVTDTSDINNKHVRIVLTISNSTCDSRRYSVESAVTI